MNCCGDCAFYEADWPYQICHGGKTYRIFSVDARTHVCESYKAGIYDIINRKPFFGDKEQLLKELTEKQI